VLGYVGESQYQLIETLAHNLAMLLLEEFSLQWIRISLNKPGAIRHSRDIGVTIERHRGAPDAGH
jgi:dihydroneopterin aldolase